MAANGKTAANGRDAGVSANVSAQEATGLPISIQGKPAIVSFDKELFWLNRLPIGSTLDAATTADKERMNPLRSYVCVPHTLVLHSSFIPDSDGGSLLLRLLAPPTNVERSALPPFRPLKSRAARTVGLCKQLDAESVDEPTRRLAAHLSGPCSNLRLVKIEARIHDPALAEQAGQWAERLMALAYPDTKPYRKIRVLINPIGGPGKAVSSFNSRVRPILDAAGCTVDATVTTHAFHGVEIAESLNLSEKYDAIACVSGDGMMHEVLNGLMKRKDADEALQIPLVPIPAGSGNAVALNLMGVTQGFNLALASLNAIKGKSMPVDLCVITQPTDSTSASAADGASSTARRRSVIKRRNTNGKLTANESAATSPAAAATGESATITSTLDASAAVPAAENGHGDSVQTPTDPVALTSSPALPYDVGYSFLSQAIGLMADVDLGTEDMRMLGDTRFVIGFINGVLVNKECEVDLYVKFGPKGLINKAQMRDRVQSWKDAAAASNGEMDNAKQKNGAHEDGQPSDLSDVANGVQPKLRHGSVMDDLPDGPLEQIPAISPLDSSWPNASLKDEAGAEQVDTPDPDRWYRIQASISALYAGKIPYVSRDLLQFPFALPQDGCVDLALMLHGGGRIAKLRGIQAAETGVVVYDPAMVYVKCEAYRVVPRLAPGHKRLKKGGLVSIDGERKPYRSFQVEVEGKRHMRILSLFGQWQVPDVAPPKVRT